MELMDMKGLKMLKNTKMWWILLLEPFNAFWLNEKMQKYAQQSTNKDIDMKSQHQLSSNWFWI